MSEKIDQFGLPVFESARRSKLDLWVDEDSDWLSDGLRDAGFKVMQVKKGKQDEQMFRDLEGDVLISKNVDDFISSAVRYDFDLISIKNVKFRDNKKDRTNTVVEKIANAIRSSGFYAMRGNWMLTLMDDGKWTLKELV